MSLARSRRPAFSTRGLGPSVLLLLASGCSSISSAVNHDVGLRADGWYVRTSRFLGMSVRSTVFHCTAPEEPGPAHCVEAEMNSPGTTVRSERTESSQRGASTGDPPRCGASGYWLDGQHLVGEVARTDTAAPPALDRRIVPGLYKLTLREIQAPGELERGAPRREMTVRIGEVGASGDVPVTLAVGIDGEAPRFASGSIRYLGGGRISFAIACPTSADLGFDALVEGPLAVESGDGFSLLSSRNHAIWTFSRVR